MSDVVDTAIFGRDRALAEIDAALRGTEVSGDNLELQEFSKKLAKE